MVFRLINIYKRKLSADLCQTSRPNIELGKSLAGIKIAIILCKMIL